MKKIILLVFTVILTSCNSGPHGIKENGKIENGVYTSNRFNWQIKIPSGYEVRTVKDQHNLEEVGYKAIQEQVPNGMTVRKNRPYLVGFDIDEKNYFSASLEPLEGTKKMTLPEHQKFISKLLADTYSTINGIKFDQELSNKNLGQHNFYIVKNKIYNQKTDELILSQLIYNTST